MKTLTVLLVAFLLSYTYDDHWIYMVLQTWLAVCLVLQIKHLYTDDDTLGGWR